MAVVEARRVTKLFGGGMFRSTTTAALQDFSLVVHAEAPSIRAASMISSGTALMAADSTTMANPVCIHTMMTMR